jgi:hypothetical protein
MRALIRLNTIGRKHPAEATTYMQRLQLKVQAIHNFGAVVGRMAQHFEREQAPIETPEQQRLQKGLPASVRVEMGGVGTAEQHAGVSMVLQHGRQSGEQLLNGVGLWRESFDDKARVYEQQQHPGWTDAQHDWLEDLYRAAAAADQLRSAVHAALDSIRKGEQQLESGMLSTLYVPYVVRCTLYVVRWLGGSVRTPCTFLNVGTGPPGCCCCCITDASCWPMALERYIYF